MIILACYFRIIPGIFLAGFSAAFLEAPMPAGRWRPPHLQSGSSVAAAAPYTGFKFVLRTVPAIEPLPPSPQLAVPDEMDDGRVGGTMFRAPVPPFYFLTQMRLPYY